MTLLERYKQMKEQGAEIYFDADDILELLEHFENTNEFNEFQYTLKLGLKLHPHNSDIRVKECKFHVYHEEYEKALQLISQIGDEDNPELLIIKLECLYATAHYNEANTYIENHPVDEELEEIYEYLVPVLSEMGKDEIACQLVKRGIKIFPDNTVLKEELCYHAEMTGNLHQAVQLCNELIDANPYSVDYWYILGRLLSNLHDYENAIEAFDFALTCDDTDIEVKLLRAYCLFMNENYEKAMEAYLDLLSNTKDMTEHIEPILAEYYMKADDFERVYTLFSRLLGKPAISRQITGYETRIRHLSETTQSEDATTQYLIKMFLAAKEIQEGERFSDIHFLHAEEIHPQNNHNLSLNGLLTDFIGNKYYLN